LQVFGTRDLLSFEMADSTESRLLQVDIWAAGLLLTYFDNMAYLPAFTNSLKREIACIRTVTGDTEKPFLGHGPTTDDVSGTITIQNSEAIINLTLHGGQSCCVRLGLKELEMLYTSIIEKLESVKYA
jgi:hypothetical protein